LSQSEIVCIPKITALYYTFAKLRFQRVHCSQCS